jgi:hypothetical protein
LTSECANDCNSQKKFEVTTGIKNALAAPPTLDQLESENRMEYGYGSGYINGQVKKEKLCFSEDPKSPCIEKVKILEAD